jgi:hypothetical protein
MVKVKKLKNEKEMKMPSLEGICMCGGEGVLT